MKQKIINFLLRSYVKVVVPGDIITTSKGNIFLGSKKITVDELQVLKAEAKALKGMRLWSIINETLKNEAFNKGWKASTTIEELNTGKAMYHTLDVQKSIVHLLS